MKLRSVLSIFALALGLQACVPIIATGVGVGITSAVDRRTFGTQVEDRTIETRLANRIEEKFGNDARVFVTSYNRKVLLTGQVKSDAIKEEVGQLAKGLPNDVQGVYNELTLDAKPSFGARSDDTLVTTKVKTRLLNAAEVSGIKVKITTESGIVYLMGLLTEQEAQSATEVASSTSGVRKVVRLFEIITHDQAVQLDNPAGASDKR